MIKCASDFNHYGVRSKIINNSLVGSEFPRCSDPEMWDHIILCPNTKVLRKKFVEELLQNLLKNRDLSIDCNNIFDMVEDVLVYLERGEGGEYSSNQYMVGMSQLFRGYAVKVWKGVNFSDCECRNMNKILI